MIDSVAGAVSSISAEAAVVLVGGVGLRVLCTPRVLAGLRVGEPVQLATSLVVREDSLTLYGFASARERAAFEVLQSANGVGPRLAQAVLGVLTPEELARAVSGGDLAALVRVPGVGRKLASRMVLDLADRLDPGIARSAGAGASSASLAGWRDQVHAGLTSLGWSDREAAAAVEAVTPLAAPPAAGTDGDDQPTDGPDVASLLRAALSTLRRA